MSNIKTRKSTISPISEFLGSPGCDFNQSELPTWRAVLLKENFVIEQGDKKLYVISDLVKDILLDLLKIWTRSNAEFKVPVILSEKAICDKIVRAWNTARLIANHKITKKSDVEKFTCKLDKLFDLCKCQCVIVNCSDTGCDGCQTGAHVSCKCPRDQKVPVLELPFMKAQREKIGLISTMQISTNDKKESDGQTKRDKLKNEEKEDEERRISLLRKEEI